MRPNENKDYGVDTNLIFIFFLLSNNSHTCHKCLREFTMKTRSKNISFLLFVCN
jgi:hypothetical protein